MASPAPAQRWPEGLTRTVSDHALGTTCAALPDAVVDHAKRVIADELACQVLGSTLTPGERVRSYVSSVGGVREAGVVGTALRAPAALAALVNGAAGHADELDGIHATQGHAGGIGLAASLAVTEARGLDGPELINAVVLSFDVGCRLVAAVGGRAAVLRRRHEHSDALHALGAAAAAGRLLRLGHASHRHALALAGLQVAMPAAFFDEREHMSKALVCGQAAAAGVTGALLAEHGVEAHDDVLEARHGVLDAWGTAGVEPERVVAGLGVDHEVLGAGFKYYSCGYPIQAPVAAALRLVEQHGIRADSIERVEIGMTGDAADVVDDRDIPSICVQDMVAVALVLGRLRFDDAHDPRIVARPDVRGVRERVTLVRDPELEAADPRGRGAWVAVSTAGGGHHRVDQPLPPGHWESGGMPWVDLRDKVVELVAPRLGRAAARRLLALVEDLEHVGDVRELTSVLAPVSGSRRR